MTNYKNNRWNHFSVSHLNTFDTEVPVYSPSVYREYRGEIFTTYHNYEHPVNNLLPKIVLRILDFPSLTKVFYEGYIMIQKHGS